MSKSILFLTSILLSFQLAAKEGMWVPGMIKQLVSDDMTAMGMKISAEDLYAINQSSIKDAVVHFGGGCTSVLVSDEALLLTNHHCGYSRIQSHSTLENNYLEDGFWAMTRADELSNPGLEATIIKEIIDVSNQVFEGLEEGASETTRNAHIAQKIDELVKAKQEETGYDAYAKAFYYGNQYLLFVVENFKDVRLVGAPPSSIGKYGFDTDNWVWPRHTGDFSIFRIYANSDNEPAEYSEDNQPYKPNHFLPINMNGVEENDFTLVYGFPGTTENYIVGDEVQQVLEVLNPLRLKMREASLGVIDQAMRADELTKIQYAAKQSRISNAYKKWIGQSKGLIRHRAVEKKDSIEALFNERIAANPEWASKYADVIESMDAVTNQMTAPSINRNYFIEFYYMGPEILRYTEKFRELVKLSKDETVSDEDIRNWITDAKSKMGYFKNYNATVDKDIMRAQIGYFAKDQEPLDFFNGLKKKKENLNQFVDRLYADSYFTSEEKVMDLLENYNRKWYKKIQADPAFDLSMRISSYYYEVTRPELVDLYITKDSLMRIWMAAQMEVLPERTYSPDANGTLRLTFGKVEGYEPFDGAEYEYYTTLKGVMEKEDPTNPEYVLPQKLKDLYAAKDYGPYAHKTGEMRVCFVASNHTSGGNSGSPVIDGNGNLIGLNFDRTWESTMSDIMFNPTICRNITVDIRYVLFIMDKFAGAKHLVDEMQLEADQPKKM